MKYMVFFICMFGLIEVQAQTIQGFLASGGSSFQNSTIRAHQVLGSTFIGGNSNQTVFISQGLLFPIGVFMPTNTQQYLIPKIAFYPNPANDWIQIKIEDVSAVAAIELRSIIDVKTAVNIQTLNNSSIQISVAEMQTGLYSLISIDKKGIRSFQGLLAIISH